MQPKADLRKALLAQRRVLPPEDVARWSNAITERVLALPEFVAAPTIYTYVAAKNEVDTRALIDAALALGKTVCCPRVEGDALSWGAITTLDALEPGPFGVLQPRADAPAPPSPGTADLCLVPAVAVRRDGHRLGQGGGYYDRFLSTFPGPRIALAYAWQWSEAFTPEPHDIAVDFHVSESETWHTNAPRR